MRKVFHLAALSLILCLSHNTYTLNEIKSEEDFNRVIQESPFVVANFFIKAATSLESMHDFDKIKSEVPGVVFLDIDVRAFRILSRIYDVRTMPHVWALVFFKDGKKVESAVISQKNYNKDDVIALINNVFVEEEVCEECEVE